MDMNSINVKNCDDFSVRALMAVTEFRSPAESGKFTLMSRSKSGKLSTIGCHFPPKATNFGTLSLSVGLTFRSSISVGSGSELE